MTLQASGAISILDVATEFSDSSPTTPHSLSEFYGADANGAGDIPASSTIALSDFYGTSNVFWRATAVPNAPNAVACSGNNKYAYADALGNTFKSTDGITWTLWYASGSSTYDTQAMAMSASGAFGSVGNYGRFINATSFVATPTVQGISTTYGMGCSVYGSSEVLYTLFGDGYFNNTIYSHSIVLNTGARTNHATSHNLHLGRGISANPNGYALMTGTIAPSWASAHNNAAIANASDVQTLVTIPTSVGSTEAPWGVGWIPSYGAWLVYINSLNKFYKVYENGTVTAATGMPTNRYTRHIKYDVQTDTIYYGTTTGIWTAPGNSPTTWTQEVLPAGLSHNIRYMDVKNGQKIACAYSTAQVYVWR
tara:strand:- start:1679 stop:2776 length:1098 start_codon:yes stop_codon:yes gene_type:complete